MKAVLLVGAVLLGLSGCAGEDAPAPDPVATQARASPTPTPKPVRLRAEVVATLPVEYDGPQGLALCGRHLAYVESQSQIVWTNWRTGASRAVFRTDHSFLYTVRRAGCRLDVFDTVNGYNGEDPTEPGRNLSLNLRTGRLDAGPPLPADLVQSPSRVTHGAGFTAGARHGYVFVRPTPGGRELRLPGHLASTGGWPVAHAHVVTYTVRVDGWTRVRVVRISQVVS